MLHGTDARYQRSASIFKTEVVSTPTKVAKLYLHLIRHHAIKTYGGSGYIDPRINLGTR
jgi:hypothetical protein